MTAKELAAALSGREYDTEISLENGMMISRKEEQAAKVAGLVVVYGYSNDFVELHGAIDAEIGAFEGATVYVNRDGLVDDPAYSDAKTIKVIWHDADSPCWTIETDIPHEAFTLMEDGEPFCVGIVFSMEDIKNGN